MAFALQVFAQQAHQKIHFRLRPPPVFQRKSVQRQARAIQPRASFDDHARGFHARSMPGNPRQMATLRPAPVAVHDCRDVNGKPVGVQLFEEGSLFGILGFERCELFHGR